MKRTLAALVLMLCLTYLAGELIHAKKELMLKAAEQAPVTILQLVPMPGSDEAVPDEPDVFREQFHHRKQGA